MKRLLLVVLFFIGISSFSFSQNIPERLLNSTKNDSEMNFTAPTLRLIASPSGQKFVLSKIKVYGWDVNYEPNDTVLKVKYLDSLLFNQEGLIETRYNAPTGFDKTIWEYDDKGRPIKINYYLGSDEYINRRVFNTYDSLGYLIQSTNNYHFGSYGSLTYSEITNYLYDSLKRLIEQRGKKDGWSYSYSSAGDLIEIASIIPVNGNWVKGTIGKTLMTYDNQHNILDSVWYEYNISEGWHEERGTRRTRDNEGRLLSQVDFFVFNDNWDSIAYNYNTNGLLNSRFHSQRILGNGGFIYDDVLEEYVYNSDNLILSTVTTEEFLDLKIKGRKSNIYDGSLLQENLYESWSDSLSAWLPYRKEMFDYSAEKYLLSCINQEYIDSLSQWRDSEKIFYKYDNYGNCINIDVYCDINGEWKSFCAENIKIPGTNLSFYTHKVELDYTLVNTIGVSEDYETPPSKFALAQNYPNPFNPETKISFSLPQSGKATLKIYDTLGREVAELVNGDLEAGTHTVNFSGKNLSSGVYIYRLQSGSFTESKKMALIK